MLGGAALVSGLLFRGSYVAREFMVALAGLGVAYSAVLLILVLGYLAWRGAAEIFSLVRMQPPRWDPHAAGWAFATSQPRRATERSGSQIK